MPDPVNPDDVLPQTPQRGRWLLWIARYWRRPAPELTVTAPPIAVEAPPSPSRVRGMALAAYRVARPVVRPVAWRSRSFLTGHVMAELLDVRTKLDMLLARTEPETHRPLDPGVGTAAERALLTLALESRSSPTRPLLHPSDEATPRLSVKPIQG